MRAKLLFVAFAAALSAASCSGKSPIAPQPYQPQNPLPAPDQTRFVPQLPMTEAMYLKQMVDGTVTNLNSLVSIIFTKDFTPKRGATLIFGPSACPSNCFQYQAKACLDKSDNALGAIVTLYFSEGGVETKGLPVGSTFVSASGGCSEPFGDGLYGVFDWAPQWLLVKGEQGRTVVSRSQGRIELAYRSP